MKNNFAVVWKKYPRTPNMSMIKYVEKQKFPTRYEALRVMTYEYDVGRKPLDHIKIVKLKNRR